MKNLSSSGGKIYKTEYKYFSYRYYMTDCVVQPGYGKAFGRKISCGDVVVYCDSKSAHLGDYNERLAAR